MIKNNTGNINIPVTKLRLAAEKKWKGSSSSCTVFSGCFQRRCFKRQFLPKQLAWWKTVRRLTLSLLSIHQNLCLGMLRRCFRISGHNQRNRIKIIKKCPGQDTIPRNKQYFKSFPPLDQNVLGVQPKC